MMIGHLEDVLLVLDMIDLLQTDDVVEGEDLEGEEVGGGLVAAEANPGKGSCGEILSVLFETPKRDIIYM